MSYLNEQISRAFKARTGEDLTLVLDETLCRVTVHTTLPIVLDMECCNPFYFYLIQTCMLRMAEIIKLELYDTSDPLNFEYLSELIELVG